MKLQKKQCTKGTLIKTRLEGSNKWVSPACTAFFINMYNAVNFSFPTTAYFTSFSKHSSRRDVCIRTR